jgi:hypothetical protein
MEKGKDSKMTATDWIDMSFYRGGKTDCACYLLRNHGTTLV